VPFVSRFLLVNTRRITGCRYWDYVTRGLQC